MSIRFVVVCSLLALAPAAHAQQFPNKPIHFIIPSAPGGGTDVLARNLVPKLGEALNQPIIVEDKPGADGVIGTDFVAKSAPDGYTWVLPSSSHAVNPTLHAKMPFDTVKDLRCITQTANQQLILVVHPSLPVHNVKELIAYARANPNKLSFASSSNATQLPMELFNTLAGTKMTNIPYKGTAPEMTDLISGRVQLGFVGGASAMPYIKAGKFRALAIGDDQRSASAPGIPTVAESGLPGFRAVVWSALFVPAATPTAIINKLHDILVKILDVPAFKKTLLGDGFEAVGSTPEQCDAFIVSEISKWAKVAKDAGLKPS